MSRSDTQGGANRPNTDERVRTMVFTLLGSGFIVDNVWTEPGHVLVECRRSDEFGVTTLYVFVLLQGVLPAASARAIARRAATRGAQPVAIGDQIPGDFLGMDWPTFQARLGGPINSWLPFEPTFPAALDALGHNRPAEGVEGRPDELFEEYVHVALQFLLESRVVRYGQRRRGEARPDGVGVEVGGMTFLYDAKAYENGYPITLDSIRQFSSYVRDFNRTYEHYVERVHSFLVVSGHFAAEPAALQERSDQMYAECSVRLTCLTAQELGSATQLVARYPTYRRSVDWRQILSRTIVTAADVERSLNAALRDHVIRRES